MEKQPPRLFEDPAASAALRTDMEHAREEHRAYAGAYDALGGAAALQAALTAGTASATASSAAATTTGAASKAAGAAQLGVWTKAALGVAGAAVLVLSGAGLHALWLEQREPAPSARSTEPHAHAAPITAHPSEPPPVTNEASMLPSPAQPSATEPAIARPHATAHAASEGEARQLARIRAHLHAGDARRALALAERGQRELGESVLWQEREALAVLALLALDQPAEAEARARALTARYPDSPFRAEIEQRLRDADAR